MRATRPTVLVLQHVACEGPGLLGKVLRAQGYRLEFIRIHRGDRVPRTLGRHAGLVVMGGPMSVYDQDKLAHLRAELALIRATLASGRPILGICLGSQLLAAALGASVHPGRRKEIGWHELTLSAAARRDPLWRGLPATFTGFHWHGDIFDLPEGATALARSALTRYQAFRFGQNAYGFLFHLEVDALAAGRMAKTFKSELLAATGATPEQLAAATEQHAETLADIGELVFAQWAGLLGARDA